VFDHSFKIKALRVLILFVLNYGSGLISQIIGIFNDDAAEFILFYGLKLERKQKSTSTWFLYFRVSITLCRSISGRLSITSSAKTCLPLAFFMKGWTRRSYELGRSSGSIVRHCFIKSLNSQEPWSGFVSPCGGWFFMTNMALTGWMCENGGSPSASSMQVMPKLQISKLKLHPSLYPSFYYICFSKSPRETSKTESRSQNLCLPRCTSTMQKPRSQSAWNCPYDLKECFLPWCP